MVIPAYNEAKRLPRTLSAIRAYLGDSSWELIVVDDGSRDETIHLAHVHLPRNMGKARAVAAGVAASHGELVLITDADLSTPIEELAKLRSAIDAGADVAIGSRAKRGAVIELSQPFYRVLMGKSFNLLVQALVLPGIWDTQCGFKLWRGDLAREVFAAMKLDGNVAFDVEVLYRARRRHCRIAELPVRWVDSVPSRISPLRHSLEGLIDLVKIRFLT